MATAVGPWQGSTPQARIECDYSVTRSADGTSATMNGTMIVAADQAISDSTNAWQVWGNAGDGAGSNINISAGSGGGRWGFCAIAAGIGAGGLDVGGRVTGLNGPGVTIEAVLHLDGVPLAPFMTSFGGVRNVTSTSCWTTGLAANGNGGLITAWSAIVSTNPSFSGYGYYESLNPGVDVFINGLTRNTQYYIQVRAANNNYGWGPWSGTIGFRTLAENPSSPGTSVDQITPTTARIVVTASADNGGAAIDLYEAYVLSNNAFPGAGGVVVDSANGGTFVADGLLPATKYYYTSRARNAALYFSAWAPMKTFDTLPSAMVYDDGVWKNAIPYVNDNGVWKMAIPYKNVDGVWVQ